MNRISEINLQEIRNDLPDFAPGDTVKLLLKVSEAGRERIQAYQGVVISRRGDGLNATFTVRKQSFGVGVERIFPLNSPKITKMEVVTRGKVRRAKLYYLRGRVGKRAKVRERGYQTANN